MKYERITTFTAIARGIGIINENIATQKYFNCNSCMQKSLKYSPKARKYTFHMEITIN